MSSLTPHIPTLFTQHAVRGVGARFGELVWCVRLPWAAHAEQDHVMYSLHRMNPVCIGTAASGTRSAEG